MRSITLAVAAVLLLASCSGDPEPIEPSDSPSSQPSAAPALPSDAENETPDGAIAFVAHWIDVFNFSVSTGELTALRELNGPACKGCDIYEGIVAKANSGAAEVRGFRWSPGKAHLSNERQLEVIVTSRPYEIRESANGGWSKVPGETPIDLDLTLNGTAGTGKSMSYTNRRTADDCRCASPTSHSAH
jgi:hypothetical protein